MPTSTVAFNLTLSNGSFSTVNLSDVTVRYWFTADGNAPSGMTFVSYYSSHAGTAICSPCPPAPGIVGTFNTAPAANLPADAYLELSFAAADGTLGAGLTGDTVAVQAAFHGPGTQYSDTFNETNDYSFDPTKKTSPGAQTTTITAYVQGQLVWGCEPGAGGSTTAGGGSSSSSGGSSSGGAEASSAVEAGGGAVDATVE
jgi:endoglucanase